MALDRINPTTTNSWKKLESLNSKIDIKSLFEKDDSRSEKYSISFGNMFVDFSKNLVDDEILETLLKLSNECNLKEAIEKQFKGDEIDEKILAIDKVNDLAIIKSDINPDKVYSVSKEDLRL